MDPKFLIELGVSFERAGLWARAAEVYDLAIDADPSDLTALSRRVQVACEHGDIDAAAATLQRAGGSASHGVGVQKALANALVVLGRPRAAADLLRRAIALEPTSALFDQLVATVMPGPTYYQHLHWLHELLTPKAYLEIGVWHGDTLRLAQPPTRAFGVDPEPQLGSAGFAAETHMFPVTSDAFFAGELWRHDAGTVAFDLTLIDGLHRFEQVLRDFVNVERHAAPGGVVVFHDTLPLVEIAAERTAVTPFWCGDVWKIVPCLARYRPDLRIVTIPTGPSGLSIVTGLDPNSTVLGERFDDVVAEIGALPYAALEADLARMIEAHENGREETARAAGVAPR